MQWTKVLVRANRARAVNCTLWLALIVSSTQCDRSVVQLPAWHGSRPKRLRFKPELRLWVILAPMLVAVDGFDRASEPSKVNFWAQAWKAAYHKARALGWLSN